MKVLFFGRFSSLSICNWLDLPVGDGGTKFGALARAQALHRPGTNIITSNMDPDTGIVRRLDPEPDHGMNNGK